MILRTFTVAITLFCISISSHAASIFNYSGVENLEWLELTATVGKSRYEVESLLSGGQALEGWRYATRSEVESLYDSLWGGITEGYSEDNFSGARTFFDAFGLHSFYSPRTVIARFELAWQFKTASLAAFSAGHQPPGQE